MTVDATRTRLERFAQGERQPRWDTFRYQPRPSMTRVSTRSGPLSARKAGARASPDDAPLSRPSRPGTTHHQGSGKSPLSRAKNGLSKCRNFSMGVYSTQHAIAVMSRVKA